MRGIFKQPPMITYIDTLNCDETLKACKMLSGLAGSFIDRGRFPRSFFTLGAASYLDVSECTSDNYMARTRVNNPILKENFGWLYRLVTRALERTLKEQTYFDPELALPGFHIWKPPAIFVRANASIHFDLQYRHLRWAGRNRADFARLFSFTLPIQMPQAGGGLNTWDISHEDYLAMSAAKMVTNVEDLTRLRPMSSYPYSPGTLVLQSGTKLHQIAPVNHVEASDARITLQGHGVWCNDKWLLYW
jgi:hypothetical protein